MRIIAVTTFSLPVDFSLSSLIEDRAAIVEPLRTCFPGLQQRMSEQDGSQTGDDDHIVLDYPEPNNAARIKNALLDGTIQIRDTESGLDFNARIYISSLSIGFAVLELPPCPADIDLHLDRPGHGQGLRELEAPYRRALGHHIRIWCENMQRTLTPLNSITDRLTTDGMLPAAKMLWWHRILLDPGENIPVSVRIGIACHLGQATCSIGYLFTSITNADEESLQEYVSGLILASQNWLIIDDATRLTASRLMRIEAGEPYNQTEIDRQYDQILDLTNKATFRSVVFSESIRYISNAELTVKNAVDEAWGITEEGRTLTDRMSALREIFNLRREHVANRRDESRNKVITALTSLTVLQCIFAWYDFYTQNDVTPGPTPRPLISTATLALTITSLAVIPLTTHLYKKISTYLRHNTNRRTTRSATRSWTAACRARATRSASSRRRGPTRRRDPC